MKILVPTAGYPPAKQSVEYIVRIAIRLQADIVVLYVYNKSHPATDARDAFDVFNNAVAGSGLSVQSRIQRGSVEETIISVAEEGDYSLIIMGASAGLAIEEWISSKILLDSQLPVVVIPYGLPERGKL